jgi:hypothetical protein
VAQFSLLMSLKRTILKSAVISVILFVVGTYKVFSQGAALTRLGMLVIVSALVVCAASTGVVALWARRSQTEWPWWRVLLTTVVCYFGIGIGIVVIAGGIRSLIR